MRSLSTALREAGHEVITTSSKQNKPHRLADMLHTIWRLRRWSQVILIDTYSTSNFWFAVACGRLASRLQIPYVLIAHGGNLSTRIQSKSPRAQRLFSGAARIVTPSSFLQNAFAEGNYKTVAIPNVVTVDDQAVKSNYDLQNTVLWVRRFHEIYDPVTAVHAFAKAYKNKLITSKLIMVGPDSDGTLLQCQRLASQLGVNLITQGLVSKAEWHAMASSADFFLNTSTVDNTPVSILEAMALGLPIVSTNAGGIPAIVQDGKLGLLVPVGDIDALASCMQRLNASRELRENLGRSGITVAESGKPSAVAAQWTALLESL